MAFAAAVACIVLAAWLIFDLCSLLPDGNAASVPIRKQATKIKDQPCCKDYASHGGGERHFITCSCYHRMQFPAFSIQSSARRRDVFLKILEEVRRKF